jgi:hypothetical protein
MTTRVYVNLLEGKFTFVPLSSNPREFPKIQDVKDPIYIKKPWGKGLPSGKLV